MPHHVLTRRDLYDRVWTEPIRTVALSLGVSDVGLAKACRVAGVPVPPRGYWAKRQHGKPTPPRPPLPPRPGGEQVVIAPPKKRPAVPPPEATAFEAIPSRTICATRIRSSEPWSRTTPRSAAGIAARVGAWSGWRI